MKLEINIDFKTNPVRSWLGNPHVAQEAIGKILSKWFDTPVFVCRIKTQVSEGHKVDRLTISAREDVYKEETE